MGGAVRVVVGISLSVSFHGSACGSDTSYRERLLKLESFMYGPLTSQGSPPCPRTHSHLFLLPSFLNSSSTYLTTRSVTLLMVKLGTRRMENLPLTEQGMTVLLPVAAAR